MQELWEDNPYPDFEDAQRRIAEGCRSVAIGPRLILDHTTATPTLRYNGHAIGRYSIKEEHWIQILSDDPAEPLLKRTILALQKEGLECC